MKTITTKDLRESLTLLLYQKQQDDIGGWKEIWNKGPQLWASLWPIVGSSGFHTQDLGGPMASQCGYVHTLPPPHYRMVIRRGFEIPPKTRFLWHLRAQSKYLLLVNQPVLVQFNQFLCMTVVEETQWTNF